MTCSGVDSVRIKLELPSLFSCSMCAKIKAGAGTIGYCLRL